MAIDWSLLRTPDIAGAFQTGLENGQAVSKQRAVDSALSQYAHNPGDQGALSRLLSVDPRTGLAVMNQQQEQQRFQATQSANAAKLQQEGLDKGMKAVGEAAYGVALLPPEQQAAAWDSQIDQLGAVFPGVAQYKGKYSPQNLEGLLAQTGRLKDVMDARAPKVVAGGSSYYDFNPNSATYSGAAPTGQGPVRLSDPSQYASLAPGTPFIDPEGNHRVKGGAAPTGPATFPGVP